MLAAISYSTEHLRGLSEDGKNRALNLWYTHRGRAAYADLLRLALVSWIRASRPQTVDVFVKARMDGEPHGIENKIGHPD